MVLLQRVTQNEMVAEVEIGKNVVLLVFNFVSLQTLKVFAKTFLFGDEKHLGDSEKMMTRAIVDPGWRNSCEDQKTLDSDQEGFGPLIEGGILSADAGRLINLVVRELTFNCLYFFNEVGGKIIYIENC